MCAAGTPARLGSMREGAFAFGPTQTATADSRRTRSAPFYGIARLNHLPW